MAKILVVDDDVQVREILERVLGGAGHKVMSVVDGLYAKQAIEKNNPDLVICDINMPKLNGDELIESLKLDPKYRMTKIMILTSLGESGRWLQNQTAADAFMSKPFENEDILQKVDELLKKNHVRIGSGKLNSSGRQSWGDRVPLFVGLFTIGIVVFLGITFLYNQIYIEPILSKPDPKEVYKTGFIADKLFVYAIPIVLVIFVYIAFLLKKFTSKKN